MKAIHLLLAAVLFALPASASSATTSTGDVDTYGMPHIPIVECSIRDPLCDVTTMTCPAFGTAEVVLRLIEPHAPDSVSLTVRGHIPLGPVEAVATWADPEVSVPFQWSGCGPNANVIVTGLVVDGELAYELFVRAYNGPRLDSICISC